MVRTNQLAERQWRQDAAALLAQLLQGPDEPISRKAMETLGNAGLMGFEQLRPDEPISRKAMETRRHCEYFSPIFRVRTNQLAERQWRRFFRASAFAIAFFVRTNQLAERQWRPEFALGILPLTYSPDEPISRKAMETLGACQNPFRLPIPSGRTN